jgi:hypothetical protein
MENINKKKDSQKLSRDSAMNILIFLPLFPVQPGYKHEYFYRPQ